MEPTWPYQLPKKTSLAIGCGVFTFLLLIVFLHASAFKAPGDFPDQAVVTISDGMSLSNAAKLLKEAHIIKSPFLFINTVIFFKQERQVVGGEYYFEHPFGVVEIARRVTSGYYNIGQLKTTIPEGSTISDISLILKRRYPTFDTVHFITLAKGKEGYLFPDTYYFGADVRPEKIIDTLTTTFNKRIKDPEVDAALTSFGRPLDEILTMASILEGEARQMRTRQIVAGILWKRIKIGIPLQVDAAFRYVNGKTTEELTLADLKIDSPYNTYLYRGLPPTPISNPGIDSIMAAVTPISSEYLYFLTDKDGNMHYAATLEQHAANKRRYLK